MVTVNCRLWTRHATAVNARTCGAAVYPTPSTGVCRQCPAREPVDPAAVAVTGELRPADDLATFRRLWAAIDARPVPTRDWWERGVLAALPGCGCNRREAAVVEGVEMNPVATLGDAVALLNDQLIVATYQLDGEPYATSAVDSPLDFADVKGHEAVKRAIAVASAGGHNLLRLWTASGGAANRLFGP